MAFIADRLSRIKPSPTNAAQAKFLEMKAAGKDVIGLAAGEPDFPTPEPIVSAAQSLLASGQIYYTSALGIRPLREAISGHYRRVHGLDISPERIIVTAGGSAALLLTCALIVDQGDEILLTDPSYPCNRHFVRVMGGVPRNFAIHAESVQNVYRDYQELSLARNGLKRIYTLTLTLTLLLALFGAVAAAFVLTRRLAAPLLILAEGTEAVAAGDFSPRRALPARDELGVLTQSFNQMTRQLEEARGLAEKNRAAVETSRAYLEGVLANLSAGVLAFSPEGLLRAANHGAMTILNDGLDGYEHTRLAEWQAHAAFRDALLDGFAAPSSIPTFTTRDVPIVGGHVWMSSAQKVKLVRAAQNALTAELTIAGSSAQSVRATAPCDAFALQRGTPTAMETPGNGRVYHIAFTATDPGGRTCSGSVEVGVPHDKKDTPVDDGPTFDSTLP